MPEGPEVGLMAEWLSYELRPPNTTLEIACVLSGRYARSKEKEVALTNQFTPILNQKITKVTAKGKLLWLEFAEVKRVLAFTLGMTGNFSLDSLDHSRIRFVVKFDDGSHGNFYFTDIRNFGTVRVLTDGGLNHKLLQLGVDPLRETVTAEYLQTQLDRFPLLTAAEFLMNQKVIAGIGNYLKAEILWSAKISPHRLTNNIFGSHFEALLEALNTIPTLSFKNGGASIRTYRTPGGYSGNMTLLFRVYGKKFDSRRNPVIREKTKDKRTTHWAPLHQS
jgi:formamidopyrimidine-DNA glycosylase